MTDAGPALFTPLTLRSVQIRNRLWVAPMCQYSVDAEDGVPTDWHLVHLGSFARGGAGLVMTEATAVSPEGRISAQDTGLYTDAQTDAWRRIVEFVHAQGATAGVQLAHAGRKASMNREWGPRGGTVRPIEHGGWHTVAPSPVPFSDHPVPRQLDEAGILQVVDDFRTAAVRAVTAGFDVIEIHAAHGYLLHQFLSPLANHRTDDWGGSLENRARLLLQVTEAVRTTIGPQRALFVRLSATDWAPDDGPAGWDPAQTAELGNWLRDAGVDLIDVSTSGILATLRIPVGLGYQVPFAEQLRHSTGMPVSAVGLITSAEQAEKVLYEEQADAIMMGRKLLRDPHYPLQAALELGAEPHHWPRAYHRGRTPLDRW